MDPKLVLAGVITATIVSAALLYLFFNHLDRSARCSDLVDGYRSRLSQFGQLVSSKLGSYNGSDSCEFGYLPNDNSSRELCGKLLLYTDFDGMSIGCGYEGDEPLCDMFCDAYMSGVRGESDAATCDLAAKYLPGVLEGDGINLSISQALYEGELACKFRMDLAGDPDAADCKYYEIYLSTSGSERVLGCYTGSQSMACRLFCGLVMADQNSEFANQSAYVVSNNLSTNPI